MVIPLTKKIAEVSFKKGIDHVVISPGSRSAPLTLAFARHPLIHTYIIPDERSAGYFAAGISITLKKPVGIVCTSGTAAINLFPAIAESFYQNIPLIVFTADRPPEWIDQDDGQTIRQDNLYGKHVKGFFKYPSDQSFSGVDHYAERILNYAINLAVSSPAGPVHINVPIREPFYPDPAVKYEYEDQPKIIHSLIPEKQLSKNDWIQLKDTWKVSRRILIVAGQERFDNELRKSLDLFLNKFQLPLIADCISNVHGINANIISHQDLILLDKTSSVKNILKPDLVITFGKSVLSKAVKHFLRENSPKHHWKIHSQPYVSDTFQSLTAVIPIPPTDFFHEAGLHFNMSDNHKDYLDQWKERDNNVSIRIKNYFNQSRFSELEATYHILNLLPEGVNLHLANSLPVRLVNLIASIKPGVEVFSNRGVSGIDGSISTMVGIACHSGRLNVLITGDMSFFYDRNGMWHNHVPDNIRIVILNNHGGGIFRIIEGPSKLAELEKYFETDQKLNARNTASDFGMEYFHCTDSDMLQLELANFYSEDGHSKILEIETDSTINKTIFDSFISQFK